MSSKGTKKRKTWRCDVCQIAVFDTYDEALDHEQSCQGNTEADIDALASAVARGRESGAITNAGDEEEEEDERGIGEAVFMAVTGGNKNHPSQQGSFRNGGGGEGVSPTVSTPTVLALLASSRANGAGGGNNHGGGAVNSGIALPDVSATTATTAAGGVTTTASNVLPNQTTQPQSTAVIAQKQNEPVQQQQQQQAVPAITVDKTTNITKDTPSPPPNNNHNNSPPPNPPRNKWRCDYCPAIFNEYDEAVIHETQCKTNKTPINNTNNNTTTPLRTPTTNKTKTPWKCDYCPALFRSYDDALVHENECKLNKQSGGGVQQVGVPTTICIPTKVGLSETTDGVNNNKAASPPPSSNINSNQKRLNWKCDVCLVAVFESYDEALAHENQCKGGGELGRDMKKTKSDTETAELFHGIQRVQKLQKQRQENDGDKETVVDKETAVEKEVVQQQQQSNVIEKQVPERTAEQQQQPQQEQLPKFQRSQVVQKETTVQNESVEVARKEQPVETNGEKKRKQPTAKESQPGLEKKRMEVRMEREREAEKERAKKAKQDAAQKAKKEKQDAAQKAKKEKEAEKQRAKKAKEAEKQKAKKVKRDAAQKEMVQGGSKDDIFLSLKDDYYRTHMFAYFRKLGALKQFQRDSDEEKRVKEEAFMFFKNSGRKLVKCHDWKRPELGHYEVDDEYARRKISDDIRRRLDQRNLWDIIVDDESSETDNSSAKTQPIERNKSPAISNDVDRNEVQEKKAPPEQPVAKEIVEEIVKQVEVQQSTVQQPTAVQPPVQEPQRTEQIVQQQKVQQHAVQPKKPSQPIVHQLIVPKPQIQRPQILEPATAQQVLLENYLTVQQDAQIPQANLHPPKMNQSSIKPQEASKTTPANNQKTIEKPPEQITATDLGIHDYVYGTSLRHHAGNRKYHEVASQKMALYQSAKATEKAGIAASVVNEWRALDPPGRFLKADHEIGYFVDVGNDKAIAKTKKILRAKPATPTKTDNAGTVPGRESTESRESSDLPASNVAANLKRSEDDTSNTNAVIASIAQMAEEDLEKETEPPQATPARKQNQAETKERRSKLRPILKLVLLLVILSIAAILSAPPHYRKRGFDILFIPAVGVLTLLLSLGLTTAYSSFTLTSATITGRSPSRRQVRSFSKVLPFLASVLIFVSVSLYLQPEPVLTDLLSMTSSISKRLFGMPQAALLAVSPILLFMGFSMALLLTHESPHHHIEAGFFQEAYNFAEDALRGPLIPSTAEEGACVPTLRDYLTHPEGFHMAFAPAFFGFFAYFGCLSALEEGTGGLIVPPIAEKRKDNGDEITSLGLRSVSGASAGAMAATLLASGIDPSVAAEFTSKFTWGMVSDPPGIGGYVKGNRFEEAMVDFLLKEASKVNRAGRSNDTPIQFDEALIPCAVSGFDLLRMKGVILSNGCMAKAARASAGFPGLFQPVAWRENTDEEKWLPDSLLIDGGIRDGLGLAGLGAFAGEKKRVVNVVVGDFGFSGPSGIHSLPEGVNASSLVSIAITGTPMCGPWAMENGKRAADSARKAMLMALDTPMEKGDGENHYVLRLDAAKFLD